jgi:glucoamylase
MNHVNPPTAFGAPGIEPRWTASSKEGIGTAYHTSSRVWFTISHGIIDEIYYPHVDCPNTRDLQFLITDGESFCHEERRDLDHKLEYPEEGCLLYRLTNSERGGRYRIIKEILTDPHSSVVLIQTQLEIFDETLRGKLRLYALLAPHIKGMGQDNSGWFCGMGGRKLFHIERENINLAFACAPDFLRRSLGYVGHSDGWQDLSHDFRMDWEFERAEHGNIALTAEIDLSAGSEFMLAVALGRNRHSCCAKILRTLAIPFARHREKFIEQWRSIQTAEDLSADTGDSGRLARLSRCILLAHEDKVFKGAIVASMSIPWGETKGDLELGGYHLVWPRDMVQSAMALLAVGHKGTALRALIWLATIQESDGAMPQNSWIDGLAHWKGRQLDEVAAPILLAWQLRRADALKLFKAWPVVYRAAAYLISHGPATNQERWEEVAGYSPSTLAAVIAALVCAADFAREHGDKNTTDFMLDYADWLSAHLEEWTVTNHGELMPEKPRHYIRINPTDLDRPDVIPDPDAAILHIANGGGSFPARNVVSADFLQLVRFGVRDPHDTLIGDSLAVADSILKNELPQGPCWRRYNHDGYGQKDDGGAFDGTGVGRSWPLLTGERGHYELAAGRDPGPFIHAMEKFANEGGMLPEQVWDADDLPDARFKRGGPTGSAMPLCWAHAEYLLLVRSRREGGCFERIAPVYQRYVKNETGSRLEMWSFDYQCPRIRKGKNLRIITSAPALIRWSFDGWHTTQDTEAIDTGIGCWFTDLPSAELQADTEIVFTFRWTDKWEEKDLRIIIAAE